MGWFWLLIIGTGGFFLFSTIASAQIPTQPVVDRRFKTGYKDNATRVSMTPKQASLYKTHTKISYFFAAIAVISLIPAFISILKEKSTPDEYKDNTGSSAIIQTKTGFEGNHVPASIDNTENQNTVSAEEGMEGFNSDFEEATQQQPTDVEQPMPAFEANNQWQQDNQFEDPITKSEPQKSAEDIATENIAAENAALLAKSVEELKQQLKN